MVNPGALESMLLMMLQLTLKLSQLKLEAEPGLLGEVDILLLPDDNASESNRELTAKIRCDSKHSLANG